ncbi:Adipokinetic hormone [Frankliniella occidentalis]|uniref:Hypertrehalosaemic prohormone n=1 Tax=Frankliniella occidentalis TaxID=133901 RepID=A0A6J1S2F6_FRAOC|nr:hypertrehalosaemic prohormone [Frankliniella occidentalis]KAE8738746.1 Adipokinetic hormone [Frankliniella occidentalis]
MAAMQFSSRVVRVVASVLLVLCATCATLVTAQVNFSPSWGKRGAPQQEACKPSMDSLMYLYKLIQDEAQKLTDCEKFAN